MAEARLWIVPVPRLLRWTAGSALMASVSGIYLAMRMSAFGQAWIDHHCCLLLIALVGALTSKRMRALRQAFASASDDAT